MNNIVDFPDPYNYVLDADDNIIGVSKGNCEIFNIVGSPLVSVDIENPIPKSELKELMVMWLALNYPDVVAFDSEGAEKT